VCRMFSDEPELGNRIGGVVGKEADAAPWRDIPHRSALADLPELSDRSDAEGVILVGSAVTAPRAPPW